jgi:hypothetical protein
LIQFRQQLIAAYEDYKYLINRGYNRKPALDLVTARYNLTSKERLLLYRCIHTDSEVLNIKSKSVNNPDKIVLDGYNLGVTLLSLMYNDEVFLCDDGFFRDLGLGKRKENPEIFDALLILSEYIITKLNLTKFEIILDSQISFSGELSKQLRERGLTVRTEKRPDAELILSREVIASNDFVILSKAFKVFNLLELIAKDSNYNVIKFPPS